MAKRACATHAVHSESVRQHIEHARGDVAGEVMVPSAAAGSSIEVHTVSVNEKEARSVSMRYVSRGVPCVVMVEKVVDISKTVDDGESWRRYRGGVRGLISVVAGYASRGVGEHTLAAAVTGHVVGVVGIALVGLGAISVGAGHLWGGAVSGIAITMLVVRHRGAWWTLRQAKRAAGASVRIVAWNVLHTNTGSAVGRFVDTHRSDVAILFEVEERHVIDVARVVPHVRWTTWPRDGSGAHDGIAVGGGEAVSSVEQYDLAGMPGVRVVVGDSAWRCVVWGFRPEAPTTPERRERWLEQLRALSTVVDAEELPVVVIGDLNASAWHTPLQDLARERGLRRASLFRRGTWRHPVLGWRGRIDHAFVSGAVGVWHSAVRDSNGSDHRGLDITVGPVKDVNDRGR